MRQRVILAALLVACSAPQEGPEPGGGRRDPATGPAADEPPPVGDDSVAPGVTREALGRILGPGPGHFFNLVHVEGVGTEDHSRLDGWRIESLPSDTPEWLDVRVGDVVTAINGMPMVQPDDAARIYEMLRVASEVRIDLSRDGERRAVRIPIIDEVETPPEGAPDGGASDDDPPGETSPPAD